MTDEQIKTAIWAAGISIVRPADLDSWQYGEAMREAERRGLVELVYRPTQAGEDFVPHNPVEAKSDG